MAFNVVLGVDVIPVTTPRHTVAAKIGELVHIRPAQAIQHLAGPSSIVDTSAGTIMVSLTGRAEFAIGTQVLEIVAYEPRVLEHVLRACRPIGGDTVDEARARRVILSLARSELRFDGSFESVVQDVPMGLPPISLQAHGA